MIFAIISPFGAIAALSLLVTLFVIGFGIAQSIYNFKERECHFERWAHIVWVICGLVSLVIINVVAYQEASKSNILYYIGALCAVSVVLLTTLSLIYRFAHRINRWLDQRKAQHPHHA